MSDQIAPQLPAKLNLFDSTMLVMGAAIGSGIFLTTGLIAQDLPDANWILLVWLVGSVLSLFGGLSFAELGAMMPSAGGQYIYLREAYGRPVGFLYGWTNFLIAHCGGVAAISVGFAEYLSYFFPQLSLQSYFWEGRSVHLSYGQLTAVLSIAGLTVVNYFGIRSGSLVQNFFSALKIAAILLLVIGGLFFARLSPDADAVADAALNMPGGFSLLSAFGISLIAVLWTFDGWYAVNCVASEIRNVKRNLPLSLILGISLIGMIYLLVNLFYVQTLPMNELQGVTRVGEKAASNLFGAAAGSFLSALILISIFGCLSATIIYGPRIFFAMANDGLFFKSMAKAHPRYHSPANAIVWQGVWSSLLCLSGTYEQLFTYVMFVLIFFYGATTFAVIVLRRTRADLQRPYRVWGYPLTPLLFTLAMLWIMISTVVERPLEAVVGIGVVLSGVPVYYYWRRKEEIV